LAVTQAQELPLMNAMIVALSEMAEHDPTIRNWQIYLWLFAERDSSASLEESEE